MEATQITVEIYRWAGPSVTRPLLYAHVPPDVEVLRFHCMLDAHWTGKYACGLITPPFKFECRGVVEQRLVVSALKAAMEAQLGAIVIWFYFDIIDMEA